MEDVLSVYQRRYDPRRPQVCVDEKSKTLHSHTKGRQPLPMRPAQEGKEGNSGKRGQVLREDYEYKREGTANIFIATEPLVGKRRVRMTEQRTGADFAQLLRVMVDEWYPAPDVEVVVLVTDNLNTHGPWVLYECFSPEEARRISERIEWHYTPEHGSWLNMAEIELSALGQQCLDRRIPNIETLTKEVAAWEEKRNNAQVTINWQFTTVDARIKLRHLYPTVTI
jgi:DDE superfamily endonuclease